jgi:hypothetical protein
MNRIFWDMNLFIDAFEGGKVSAEPLAPVRFRR